ncbi:hypothetical protein [Streptosporangium vulgare]|uniref:hypothetical protein n=1 Tax=Streptosporangium vulgare TaxID=46190 RepID=UPI00336EE908
MELQQLVQDLAAHRAEHPTTDLTSSLVNANIDGEKLTMQELGSFFILLVVAGNETTATPSPHGLRLFTEHPDSGSCCSRTSTGACPVPSRRSSASPHRSTTCAARSPATTR